MTDLCTMFPPDQELAGMESKSLLGLLGQCAALSVESVSCAARIIRLLDSRGVDLSEFNQTMLRHLRRIASNQLLPELLLNWRDTAVYARTRLLPLPEQKAVVSNEPIRVVAIKDGGELHAWVCEPRNMTPAVAKQVFASDHIRNDAEQIAYIRSMQTHALEKRPYPLPYEVKRNSVEFTRPCRLTKRDLQRLLKGMD